MNIRWLGAILIVAGCGGFGFAKAAAHITEERCLRQLLRALDYMECELQYRKSALPNLLRCTAAMSAGVVRDVLLCMCREMEDQVSPDAAACVEAAVGKVRNLPPKTKGCILEFGRSAGYFDLNGQIEGLEAVRAGCRRELDVLSKDRDVRLRSFETLGLCAGAALAILLI